MNLVAKCALVLVHFSIVVRLSKLPDLGLGLIAKLDVSLRKANSAFVS